MCCDDVGPTKLKGLPRAWCELKCNISCFGHAVLYDCVLDCENKKC